MCVSKIPAKSLQPANWTSSGVAGCLPTMSHNGPASRVGGRRGVKIGCVIRPCLVEIPAPSGGNHPYEIEAASKLEAAAIALRLHTKPVADDAVITVIPEGMSPLLWNAPQINAQRRSYGYRSARAIDL